MYPRWVLSFRASGDSERSEFTIVNGVAGQVLVSKPFNDREEQGLPKLQFDQKKTQ